LCAVIAYGGESVVAGSLSVGSLVAFYGFVTQLFEPLSGATELYARAQKTFASVRQIQSVLALRPKVEQALDALQLSADHQPKVEFAAVEFSYPRQKDLLHVPALQILPGERVAMAGANGAGKSTLGKLMVRLYDPVRGSIRLGGEDIRNIRLESLRQHICYLAHEPILFDGTLASNLRLVRSISGQDDLEEAIRAVGLSAFVATLPDGLRQHIGPRGCQLSGGQRQRLAIARALLQRPRILILDEATSCLDAPGEAAVLENIQRQLPTSTLVVVSHRFSTFSGFRRILTVSAGRIVECCDPDGLSRAQHASCTLAVHDIADSRELSF
jgi:ABC-type multidrug transport system fused ATPase/permease subunit